MSPLCILESITITLLSAASCGHRIWNFYKTCCFSNSNRRLLCVNFREYHHHLAANNIVRTQDLKLLSDLLRFKLKWASVDASHATPQDRLAWNRSHGLVESHHHIRDVTFKEGDCTARTIQQRPHQHHRDRRDPRGNRKIRQTEEGLRQEPARRQLSTQGWHETALHTLLTETAFPKPRHHQCVHCPHNTTAVSRIARPTTRCTAPIGRSGANAP